MYGPARVRLKLVFPSKVELRTVYFWSYMDSSAARASLLWAESIPAISTENPFPFLELAKSIFFDFSS
jgi:hypothetical protein